MNFKIRTMTAKDLNKKTKSWMRFSFGLVEVSGVAPESKLKITACSTSLVED